MYYPSDLVSDHKVIVVTVNYRMSNLGWFRHPSLRTKGSSLEDASGSFGTLDNIMALRWIRENISAIGGDPENVTIFGESAGGHNVAALYASPLARGLFHKAIVQSGVISHSDIEDAVTAQKTQSIESVGTVITEDAKRTEKILPEGSVEEKYQFAVSFIKVGDYETAELALREFVDTNPKHQLAGNAQYWYGETFRVRQLYQDAATAYLDGYQKYPKSGKAPVNLLKLGVMLVQIGEKEQGCSMIMGVKEQYPEAKQSVFQKAEYEKKKFNCDKKS